ncbi:MAG TPA: hypothetical protein DDX98_07735 [Bacteroidales bacterium]|nr:hypothetical protein [Bacteroidales bacterium]
MYIYSITFNIFIFREILLKNSIWVKIDLSENDLLKYRDNADIVKQTALQIIKDFGLFGLSIEFPSDIKYAYPELSKQLNAQVFELLHSSNTKLLSLLYQIDIPEKAIQQKASAEPDRPLSEVVTELIFLRELKKVLTRLYFKEHGI